MNKNTLVWTLIVAVPVGLAALATAYVYRDTGKLPFQDTASTPAATATDTGAAQSTASADKPASAGGTETASADGTAGDGTAASASAKSLSFDVVGVEATGETVVAGRSDAGAIVALTANGKVVGKSIANEIGEWTIILDEPLKPGDYDVGLEVHDEAGAPVAKSEEHVVVSLPEGGKQQPLVVLNTPDGPSDILQKPATEQAVAEAAPAAAAQSKEGAEATADAGADATETAVASLQTSGEAPAGTGETQQQAQAQSTAPEASADENQTAASSQGEGVTPAADGEAQPEAVAAEAPAAPDGAPEAGGSGVETEVAAVEPAVRTRTLSGNAETEETGTTDTAAVQDDTTQAGSETSATKTAKATSSEPEAGADTVESAAATQDPGAQDAPSDAAPAVTAKAAPAEAAPAEPTVTVEAVESEKDKVFVAGTGEPGSSVRVYVGDDFQGEAQVNSGGKWLVQGSKNITEGNVEVRADLIAEDGNTVDARAAVTFEKEQDKQIVLTKVVASGASGDGDGQGAEVKKSLPVVIIRKGDNLWRISRRLYGHGVRYTTIYQANQEQIRNPDLIYPGQVFLTPEGDLNWKQENENNG